MARNHNPQNPAQEAARIVQETALDSLREKNKEQEDRIRDLQAQLKTAEESFQTILGIKNELMTATPRQFKIKAEREGEATAIALTSDWHLEERVDPMTVNGLNEYNLTIAKARIEKFFQGVLSLLDVVRHKSRVKRLVLAVLGDLITGYLHEELMESNYLSPTQALLKAHEFLRGGIDFLLANGDLDKLLIPCIYGNHGRTTMKPRVSTAAWNSFEWLMYQFTTMFYANEPRVEFTIANSYFVFMEVYGRTFRMHHGDGIMYQGGVGGMTIPLNKSIAQWNKEPPRPAHYDLFGHWHTSMTATNFVANGSVIGYNAWARRIKASYEKPAQRFLLMHPEYGKTIETPIIVG